MVHAHTDATRLAALERLRREVDVEIRAIKRRLKTGARKRRPRQHRADAIPGQPSSLTVKRWAVEQGLLPAVARGRVSQALRDAYADAHQDVTP